MVGGLERQRAKERIPLLGAETRQRSARKIDLCWKNKTQFRGRLARIVKVLDRCAI